jgi:hypothetical protein
MSTTTQRRQPSGPARPIQQQQDPRRFATRVKRLSLAISVAAFGMAWALASQNVVGATSAPAASGTAPGTIAGGRATQPSSDFFGQPAGQPQPIIGNGGGAGAPVVRGRTS